MTTPTMRVCAVTTGEDFTALQTTDRRLATLDVVIVVCGSQSDARVKLVTDEKLADEFIIT